MLPEKIYVPSSLLILIIAVLLSLSPASAHKANEDAQIYFVNLADGMTVTNPIHIKFGAEGIRIAPVGEDKHRTGHHHLLIDVEEPISIDDILPFDKKHLHYINGQTEAELSLPLGQHR